MIYADNVHISDGSIKTIHNDLLNVILPVLEDYNVEITIHNGDRARTRPDLPGIWFAWGSNLRAEAFRSCPIIGAGHTIKTTTQMIGPQLWSPTPAAAYGVDTKITLRKGLKYHYLPMAVNRDELPPTSYHNHKKGILYFASSDTHKSFIKNKIVELIPDLAVIYAHYTTPRRQLLEYVSRFKYVISAGYCAVESMALGCKVIWAARRLYQGISNDALKDISTMGFTGDNRLENLEADVELITVFDIRRAMDEAQVIKHPEVFHLQNYLHKWASICETAMEE